jgi:hypothetical protein
MGTNVCRRRRWTASLLGVGALMFSAGGALAVPAGATAAESTAVDFPTHCIPPAIAGLPPIDGTTTAKLEVDNPTPAVGDTVTVTYTVLTAAAANPTELALPADIMTPTGKIQLSGAQSGAVTVAGPKKNEPVPGKAPFPSFSMTGTFKVTDPGEIKLSPGDYNIHTSYIMELDTPCTVTNPPAPVSETITATGGGTPVNDRTVSLASASGKAGDPATVTGAHFTPSAEVTVAGWDGSAPTADRATVSASDTGAFTAKPVINDPKTVGIVAWEGASWDPAKGAGPAAYTVVDDTPVPAGSQRIVTSVRAGTLTMSQAGDTVTLDPVDFGTGGRARGQLNKVTVQDFRGGSAGWSLTGKVTDFQGPGGATIDAKKLGWLPGCTTVEGSPSTCAAGRPVYLGADAATLASAPDSAHTGGEFVAEAALTLNVPKFTPAGSYSAVLTLTLT